METVLYEARDGIAIITLNRPEALNAMNDQMINELHASFESFNDSDERVAIITGAGERAFSAGADLKNPPTEMWQGMPGIGIDVAKPLICAVDGHCIGGGYVLMQMCDLAVASDRALFSYPEVQVGFTGGLIAGCAARIPQKIAMEFMLLGQRFDARRALEAGMINKVVAPEELMGAAMEYANVLRRGAPLVIEILKKHGNELIAKGPAEKAARIRGELLVNAMSADRQEGARAFKEKRAPGFCGK